MKRLIFVFLILVCSVAFAQDFQGLRIGPGTGGSAGSGLVWNEDFSGSYVATDTWGINASVGKTAIVQNGDGYLQIGGGGPVTNYGTDFNPQGLFRTITGDFTLVTKFAFSPSEQYQTAGLCVSQGGGQSWMTIFKSYASGNSVVGRRDTVNGTSYDSGSFPTFSEASNIYMKITRVGTALTAYYGTNGTDWTEAGNTSTKYAPDVDDSLIVWLINLHTIDGNVATATFDYCNISRP